METKEFSADVDAWIAKSQRRLDLVARRSTGDVIGRAARRTMGITRGAKNAKPGFIPVDLSTLSKSLVSTIHGGIRQEGADSHRLIIGKVKSGDVISFMWGGPAASYARHVHYGTKHMDGWFWIDRAVVNWQAIVRRNAIWVRNNVK